jgi:hypothetical protein
MQNCPTNRDSATFHVDRNILEVINVDLKDVLRSAKRWGIPMPGPYRQEGNVMVGGIFDHGLKVSR